MTAREELSKVALLVDGDNVPPRFAGQILRVAEKLGPLTARRVYGNAARNPQWEAAPSYRLVHAGNSKNGADILLAIDAMELALRDGFAVFVIASSDRDFSHIAHRLRELGFAVHGVGEADKAPDHFRKACDTFSELKLPDRKQDLSANDRIIVEVLDAIDTTGEGALVTSFNAQMRRRHDFKISEEPEKTWAKYFAERPKLYSLSGNGAERRVRRAFDAD